MLLKVTDVARRLGVSVDVVRALIRNGELAVVDISGGKVRSRIRITEDEYEAFIARRSYDAPDAPAVLDRSRRTPRAVS